MDHEAPGNPDLTHKPPLLDLKQWRMFCHAYHHQPHCPEGFTDEKRTLWLAKESHPVAIAQWAAWLRWVAVYKLTGDGRGSFAAGEG